MSAEIMRVLGGIGLFLLGMIWLTEGLRGLSGRALRTALARFTRTPLSGAVTGAVTTAIIQSSSATTVTAVGFVGAGLLTFPQALGIVFGASLGTTATGWIVAILGFKLQLGEAVLPLVLAGALLKMFGGRRAGLLGTALAGFSLLFIGIDAMREGMEGFEGVLTPESFPGDSLAGRLQLVLIGVAITMVTQSSSAGVAAALATLGGTTASRRTGLSHMVFNLMTGMVAFALLGPFTAVVVPRIAGGDPQIALVAFHTGYNLLGVMLVLPFTRQFARLVAAVVPERGPRLTRGLEPTLLGYPDAAADAAAGTVTRLAQEFLVVLARRLRHGPARRADAADLRDLAEALAETRTFIEAIGRGAPASVRARRIGEALHILDHLGRLYYRCTQSQRIETLADDHRLRRLRGILRRAAAEAAAEPDATAGEARLNRVRRILRSQRHIYRETLLVMASTGRIEDAEALLRLDSLRWLHRVSYHLWRIQHHLGGMRAAATPSSPRREAAVEVLND